MTKTWTGEVKLQIQLDVPIEEAAFLVKSEDGAVVRLFRPNQEMREMMRGRVRAYFTARLDKKGLLVFGEELPDRLW